MLLSAAKCQGYSIYHFFVIKGKPTVVGVKLPRLGLKQTKVKSQSVSDCITQNLRIKFVLKDIEACSKACK